MSATTTATSDRSSRLLPPFVLALAGMVLILQLRPIHDVDVFWQVKLGELMLAHGGLVEAEPFSASHAGESHLPLAWLGQLVFASIHRLGGWTLLHVVNLLIWAAAFLIVAHSARRVPHPQLLSPQAGARGDRAPLAALVALALGFMASLPFASLRPQSFAVLSFALLLALMRSRLSLCRKLALAAFLLVLWQNLHPSVTIAVVASGGAAAFGWIGFLRDRSNGVPLGETLLMGMAAVAMILTPAGFSLFALAGYNAEISRELGVGEWLPLWSPVNRAASLPAWLALAATLVLFVRGRGRVRSEDLGRGVVLTVLMLTAYRFAPFWALAMIPLWSDLLAPAVEQSSGAEQPASSWRALVMGSALVIVSLIVGGLIRPRLFHESLAVEGIDQLRAVGVEGVVYCHPALGGPLIEAGYPGWKVAYDGRYYLYSLEEWRDYLRVARGEVSLASVEQKVHPVAFVLRPNAEGLLIQELRAASAWEEIHSDEHSAVFVLR
jgi:hypothetical protein